MRRRGFRGNSKDAARGARQTAYRVLVATRAELLTDGKADVWDSGKVSSGQSLNVKYAGPAVKPSTRYWWRVEMWGADGKAYPASAAEWWETGLLNQGAGAESGSGGRRRKRLRCEKRRRCGLRILMWCREARQPNSEQRFAYRTIVTVEKPVERAVLFATGEDTVAAWVNGEQVMTAAAYPPYHHLPWKKFVRADVTAQVAEGQNTIAIESVHYIDKYGEKQEKGCSADDRDGGAAL